MWSGRLVLSFRDLGKEVRSGRRGISSLDPSQFLEQFVPKSYTGRGVMEALLSLQTPPACTMAGSRLRRGSALGYLSGYSQGMGVGETEGRLNTLRQFSRNTASNQRGW